MTVPGSIEVFNGFFILDGSSITNVNFSGVRFIGPSSFVGTRLGERTLPDPVWRMRARALRSAARLDCEPDDAPDPGPAAIAIARTTFEEGNFTRAAVLPQVSFILDDVAWGASHVPWTVLPPYEAWASAAEGSARSIGDALAILERHYRSQGDLSGAMSAKKLRGLAEANTLTRCFGEASGPRCPSRAWVLSVSTSWQIFWNIVSGNGTSFWRVLLTITIVDLGFALLFVARGGVETAETRPRSHEPGPIRFHPLLLPSDLTLGAPSGDGVEPPAYRTWMQKRARSLWAGIRLSTAILTRISSGNVRAAHHVRRRVVAEWLIGIALIVAAVYTLAESQPFVHRLIRRRFEPMSGHVVSRQAFMAATATALGGLSLAGSWLIPRRCAFCDGRFHRASIYEHRRHCPCCGVCLDDGDFHLALPIGLEPAGKSSALLKIPCPDPQLAVQTEPGRISLQNLNLGAFNSRSHFA